MPLQGHHQDITCLYTANKELGSPQTLRIAIIANASKVVFGI